MTNLFISHLQFNLALKEKQRGFLKQKEEYNPLKNSLNFVCEVKGVFVNVFAHRFNLAQG